MDSFRDPGMLSDLLNEGLFEVSPMIPFINLITFGRLDDPRPGTAGFSRGSLNPVDFSPEIETEKLNILLRGNYILSQLSA